MPPPPTRRINDYAGALSAAERARLEQKLIEHEASSTTQIVVAIFESLRGENLEDYSIRLAQAWRVGQKGLDNGVIFLVFLDDRKLRLEVGYGLEGRLTDATAGSIIRDTVAPRFREKRYADGIAAGLDAIAAAIAGAYARPTRPAPSGGLPWAPYAALILPVIALVGIGYIIAAASRTNRTRRRGWSGGRGGWTDIGPPAGPSSSPSWSGSSSDSFSGGGGSFGGGGASGSW